MSDDYKPAEHATIVIERNFAANIDQVYEAWTNPEVKARWFKGPVGWRYINRSLDFREGGSEILHGEFEGKFETLYTAHIHHIIDSRRIVYDYIMHLNNIIHSVSLSTVEFEGNSQQTKMKYTEQISYLDGTNADEGAASREGGVNDHFDTLEHMLTR